MVYIQPDMWISWAQEDINGSKVAGMQEMDCRFYLYK